MEQATLFPAVADGPRPLALLGEQKDIRYHRAVARRILNDPAATGMGYWSINPYVGCAFGCAYCYARFAHQFAVERAAAGGAPVPDEAPLPPWLAFERRILVKHDAAELLRRELGRSARERRSLGRGAVIVIGTATDPYQPAERRFRVTRGILEVLAAQRRLAVGIITKSPLVTRDVDVLARLAARSRLTVHVSLITVDRELARRLEPRAPTPEARLRAIARLREAGIDVGVNVMPVLPGITDAPAALLALVERVAGSGATHVNASSLQLRSTARERYLPVIEREFPHLLARYRNEYARGHRINDRYRAGLRRFLAGVCARVGIRFGALEDEEEEGEAGHVSTAPRRRAGDAWRESGGDARPDGGAPTADAAPRQLALPL